MPKNVIGKIPEFTDDDSVSSEEEQEVKESPEETQGEVKETPLESSPEEKPTEEPKTEEAEVEPEAEPEKEEPSEDTTEEVEEPDVQVQKEQALKEVAGLYKQKAELLEDIKKYRGDRRELKEAELKKVETTLKDELKDINPEDIPKVERIVKQRGYIQKEEVQKMLYNNEKQKQLDSFLNKYPEYKPENDPEDKNWKALQNELSYYRMPDDATKISAVLEKARKGIQPVSSERDTQPVKERLKVAQKGAGSGIQRSSPRGRLSAEQKAELSRGGFTPEDIREMDKL